MGEVAEMMTDGTLCNACGCALDFSEEFGETAYSMYDLNFGNRMKSITRKDHEILDPDLFANAEDGIADWDPFGIPLLCEGCYKDYLDNSVVHTAKIRITYEAEIELRSPDGMNLDDIKQMAMFFYSVGDDIEEVEVVSLEESENQFVNPDDRTVHNPS